MNSIRKLAAAVVVGLSISAMAVSAMAQVLPGQAGPFPLNLLDNGNFNVATRGTTAKTGIANTATYLWDRWAGYGGSSSSVSLTNITSSLPAGANTPNFTNAAQVQRASSNSNTAQICLVQEIPTADIIPLQGQPFTLSFWALAGSNFSAASSNLTVQVTTGTGTDQGLASLISGWTGAATPLSTTQAITANWQRFAWTGTTAFATTATEAAVQLCFTPVGTAGTNDYFQTTGVQLERGTVASNFEWRDVGFEALKDAKYFQCPVQETGHLGSPPQIFGTGVATAATTGNVWVPYPTMRTAPSAAVSTAGSLESLATVSGLSLTSLGIAPVFYPNGAALPLVSSSGMSAGQVIFLASGPLATGQYCVSSDF